jgi:ATP-binding cassette subfamily B protein
MGFHGGGWFSYLGAAEEKPKVTAQLLRRVLGYSRPYQWLIAGMLGMIILTTGLNLLNPLILRDLIDRTIPSGDLRRLAVLALALLLIPGINAA